MIANFICAALLLIPGVIVVVLLALQAMAS